MFVEPTADDSTGTETPQHGEAGIPPLPVLTPLQRHLGQQPLLGLVQAILSQQPVEGGLQQVEVAERIQDEPRASPELLSVAKDHASVLRRHPFLDQVEEVVTIIYDVWLSGRGEGDSFWDGPQSALQEMPDHRCTELLLVPRVCGSGHHVLGQLAEMGVAAVPRDQPQGTSAERHRLTLLKHKLEGNRKQGVGVSGPGDIQQHVLHCSAPLRITQPGRQYRSQPRCLQPAEFPCMEPHLGWSFC